MPDVYELGKRIARSAGLTAFCILPLHAQDAKTVINRAIAAAHSQDVESLQIAGHGFDALFGQAYDGDSPWPRFALTRYRLSVSYKNNSLQDERTRVQAQNPPLGGGNQPIGEQHQTQFFRDGYAWNLSPQGKAAPAAVERDLRSAAEARQFQVLFTPQGFFQAVLHANATVREVKVAGKTKTVISFPAPNKTQVEGTLDEQDHLERIRTWVETPVLGDVVLDVIFSEYRDFDGVLFPQHIVQSEGGYPVLDLSVTSVSKNSVDLLEVPTIFARL
jgi:hypothetical protein